MIKAAGKAGSMPMLAIGLSAENARRLLDDQPILFDTTELGLPPLLVLVCGGETEDQIAADLRKHFPSSADALYEAEREASS